MPSIVQRVVFNEKRFIGATQTFTGSTITDLESPFTFDATIVPELPNPEREIIILDVQSAAVTDSDGTVYSGQFRVRRSEIQVTGSTLSASQITTIKNAISINEVTSTTGVGSNTTLRLSLIPIASSGARLFDITIPYRDSSIIAPISDIQISFLEFDGSNINTTQYPNAIIVAVDRTNARVAIDAGLVPNTANIMALHKKSFSNPPRVFNYINVSKQAANQYIQVDVSEDLTGNSAIFIRPTGVTSLTTQQDGSNLYVKTSSILWRPYLVNPINNPTGFRKLNVKCEYGISKSNSHLSEIFRVVGPAYRTTGGYPNNSFSSIESIKTGGRRYLTFNLPVSGFLHDSILGFSARYKASELLASNSTAFYNVRFTTSPSIRFNWDVTIDGVTSLVTPQIFAGGPTVKDAIDQVISILRVRGFSANQMNITYPASSANLPISYLSNTGSGSTVTVGADGFANKRWFLAFPSGVPTGSVQKEIEDHTTVGELYDWINTTLAASGWSTYWKRDIVSGTGEPASDWMNLPAIPVLFAESDFLSFSQPVGQEIDEHDSIPALTDDDLGFYFFGKSNFFRPDSPYYEGVYTNSDISSPELTFNTAINTTVSAVAAAFQTIVDSSTALKFPSYFNIPTLSLTFEPVSYFSSVPSENIDYHQNDPTPPSSTPNLVPPDFTVSPGNISIRSQPGKLIFGSTPLLYSYQIPVIPGETIQTLIETRINGNTSSQSVVEAYVLDDQFNQYLQLDVTVLNNFSTPVNINNMDYILTGTFSAQYARTYDFANNPSLDILVQNINRDWGAGVVNLISSVSTDARSHSDAVTANLVSDSQIVTAGTQPHIFLGTVHDSPIIIGNTEIITISCDIGFAVNVPVDPTPNSGVQVAFGGYEKNGTFYSNHSPNQFFEPVQNSVFPISFRATDADIVYLLVRSRVTTGDTVVYTSTTANYTGQASFSNGTSPYSLTPFHPTTSKFTSVWNQGGSLGVTTAIPIPMYSTVIDVTIEDRVILDSVNLQIINSPSELDEFGFLAVNRTNNTKSQLKSKVARVFGLVLDNRGSWDVLISPEAILEVNPLGSIAHLGTLYTRTLLDDDEGYDFSITTSLPTEIQNSVSVSPVVGHPQVWVLKVEYAVKRYLANQIALRDDENSLDGCSIDIDILVTGRISGVQGTARVTIYYDFTCVYDIGLCDFFWNLIDPPKPTGPEIIQNKLSIAYQTLIDCDNITTPLNNNIAINAPILISISNIPTFINGNALLLIKSTYTAEIQGFYFPTGNELDAIEFSNCSLINLNLPLTRRLNKEFLLLPGNDNPIEDISQIRSLLITERSYLWMKPQLYFPPTDVIKDCGSNEIVIVGLGYRFKNWTNGVRQDDVIVGAELFFPQGIFSAPEMKLCYRYYYNQYET